MGNLNIIRAAAGKSRGHWVPAVSSNIIYVRGSRKRHAVLETVNGKWIGVVWDSGMPEAVFSDGTADEIAAKCAYTMGLEHEEVPNV